MGDYSFLPVNRSAAVPAAARRVANQRNGITRTGPFHFHLLRLGQLRSARSGKQIAAFHRPWNLSPEVRASVKPLPLFFGELRTEYVKGPFEYGRDIPCYAGG